jgi:hypothetical protein
MLFGQISRVLREQVVRDPPQRCGRRLDDDQSTIRIYDVRVHACVILLADLPEEILKMLRIRSVKTRIFWESPEDIRIVEYMTRRVTTQGYQMDRAFELTARRARHIRSPCGQAAVAVPSH